MKEENKERKQIEGWREEEREGGRECYVKERVKQQAALSTLSSRECGLLMLS